MADGVGAAPDDGPLRGRRLALTERGPYPTSTEVRPPGAGPPIRPGSTGWSSAGVGTSGTMSSRSAAGVAGGSEAGAGTGVPAGATSMPMIGVPTSTVCPSPTYSSATTPAYGDGSSTAAFAVSISTSVWFTATVSPGCTNHFRISPSVSPSPTSGSLNCFTSGTAAAPQKASERSTASSTRSRSGR